MGVKGINSKGWECRVEGSGEGDAISCQKDSLSLNFFSDVVRVTKFEEASIQINNKKIKTPNEKRGLYPSIDIK